VINELKKISVRDCRDEIIIQMNQNNLFGSTPEHSIQGMTFYEFTLEELGFPPADILLEKIQDIRNQVGIKGWKHRGIESRTYRGFSLTYNPDFIGEEKSIYHQTWGSTYLPQNYGRINGVASINSTKNSYYDSYAFRKIPPIVESNLRPIIDKLSMSLLRSRAAWHFAYGKQKENIEAWHVDEFPYHILRVNIPVQTSEEHVIDIVGNDDFGNSLDIRNKHLEVGKAYIWNTRIPHCVSLNQYCQNLKPRIHIVLGLCPWFHYNSNDDNFVQNSLYGQNLDSIIRNKLFVK